MSENMQLVTVNNEVEEEQQRCPVIGCLYISAKEARSNQNEDTTIKILRILLAFLMAAAASVIIGGIVWAIALFYPFKTVEFIGTPPITITNPDKMVPLGGVIKMSIKYTKHINESALIIRTLIRKKGPARPDKLGQEILPLESSTVVSTRKKGSGVTESLFVLGKNPELVGPDTYVVFSIYYNLFGLIPRMVQFESESFTIFDTGDIERQCPQPPKSGGVMGLGKNVARTPILSAMILWKSYNP